MFSQRRVQVLSNNKICQVKQVTITVLHVEETGRHAWRFTVKGRTPSRRFGYLGNLLTRACYTPACRAVCRNVKSLIPVSLGWALWTLSTVTHDQCMLPFRLARVTNYLTVDCIPGNFRKFGFLGLTNEG